MKILVVIPYLAPCYGGTSKSTKELAESLAKLDNISVDIITTNANNGTLLKVNTYQWFVSKNCRVRYFQAWHRVDLIISLPLIWWFIRYVRNYDLVHTSTIFSPTLSCIHGVCRLLGIPYFMTPRGMLEPWALSYKTLKKKLYFNFIEKPFLKNSRYIQAVASPEAENIRELGFKNVITVPNGLSIENYLKLPDAKIFHRAFPQTLGKKLVFFLGRIDPKKGLDLLAPAFAQLHSIFSDTHLVIAGPDLINFTSTVQGYFDQLNCLDAVTFTGMLTGELKYAALAAASLYVAPSYSEGFSMSILEGMAAGLPCVFTEVCNFPEAKVAEAAYVVPIDSQAIAEALLNAFRNPEQSRRVGANARKLILDHYTWEKSAQSLATAYRKVLGES